MKTVVLTLAFLCCLYAKAQKDLPLQYTGHTDTTTPLIVYLSGDGGMNSFTKTLIKSLNTQGYAVLALDSKDYFWKKKEPQQFATDMSQAISNYLKEKKRNSFIILGYSFGADVAPFLATRLPAALAGRCKHVIMLSPSANTEFEIKLTDMLGFGNKKGKNVVNELNKMSLPLVLFFGKDENDFPVKELTIKKQVVVMEGGHHYDNNVDELAGKIIGTIK
jgi:type IV secretory pathway VirJ component